MDDWPFWREVAALAGPPCALLETTTGGPFRPPPAQTHPDDAGAAAAMDMGVKTTAAFAATPLRLTGEGRAALAGGFDGLYGRRPRRWVGGVELRPGHYWRWDGRALTQG